MDEQSPLVRALMGGADRWQQLPESSNVQDRRGDAPVNDMLLALAGLLRRPMQSRDMVLPNDWQNSPRLQDLSGQQNSNSALSLAAGLGDIGANTQRMLREQELLREQSLQQWDDMNRNARGF